MSITDKVEEIKIKGFKLDFGTVFNNAFENYKKIALYAGSMLLVFTVILMVVFAVILISIYGIPKLMDVLKPENLKVLSTSSDFIIANLAFNILFSSFTSPFFAGLINMVHSAKMDEEFHVSTAFKFYKTPYFKELFGATFIISILNVISTTLIDYSGFQLLSILISIAITIFTLLTIPLIIFSDLKAISAIKSSCIIVSKQPMILFGLMAMGFLFSIAGMIGCFIGLFFTFPFMYSMYYSIYESIIGFE